MRIEKPVMLPNIRLGSIEAFLVVARVCSYEIASGEIKISPTNVQRNVSDLEIWLRRVLVMDDCVPLELGPDGKQFYPIAVQLLEMIEGIRDLTADSSSNPPLSLRKSARSNLSLNQFQTLLLVADSHAYKTAASLLSCDVKTVRDRVGAISKFCNTDVFMGHSVLQSTEHGEVISKVLRDFVAKIESFRASLPGNNDSFETACENLSRFIENRTRNVISYISLAERSNLSLRGNNNLMEVRRVLAILNRCKIIVDERLRLDCPVETTVTND